MTTARIETQLGTYHMPLTTFFRARYRHEPGDFPVTDRVARRALTLPLFPGMTTADSDRACLALLDLLKLHCSR